MIRQAIVISEGGIQLVPLLLQTEDGLLHAAVFIAHFLALPMHRRTIKPFIPPHTTPRTIHRPWAPGADGNISSPSAPHPLNLGRCLLMASCEATSRCFVRGSDR